MKTYRRNLDENFRKVAENVRLQNIIRDYEDEMEWGIESDVSKALYNYAKERIGAQ